MENVRNLQAAFDTSTSATKENSCPKRDSNPRLPAY